MTATTTPTMAPLSVDTIPDMLKTIPQFVVWRYECRDGDKPTKVPYSPLTIKHAAVNNPYTWSSFSAAMQHRNIDPATWGIGVVITPATGLVGLDLDHCLEPFSGDLLPWATEIVTAINSYTEISPSGEGLRIWVKGTLPAGRRRKDGLEMYDSGRYLTVTGAHLEGTPATIEERTEAVAALHASFFAQEAPVAAPATQSTPVAQPSMSDQKLLQKARSAKNGAQFTALYDRGEGTADDSANDLALCNFLAYWTGKDASRMDRMFRASKLYRPKWDKKHSGEGKTYGAMTIDEAISKTVNVYDPQGYKERQRQPAPAAYPGSDPAPGTADPLDTFTAPALRVANNIMRDVPTEKGMVEKPATLRVQPIRDTLKDIVGDWPRRLGNMLFVHEGDTIRYMEKPGQLFAWLHERAEVSWRKGVSPADNNSFVSEEQFFSHLTATATNYENIARLPHEPRMEGYYYAWEPLADYVPTGEYLDTLVNFFANVETPHDAALVRAMFMTPFWGGTLGRRPIFALAAPDKGYGKSTLAQHVGTLAGGFIEFRSGQRAEDDFVARLLTPSEQHKRVVRYDNIKGEFHSATVEGIITSPTISGKRMYTGEATRPNDLTWVITGNGLRLSGDIAQRVYVIRLVKPQYTPDWDEKIERFIKEHGPKIHMDILAAFQRPPHAGKLVDRWSEWVHGVLRRCTPEADAVLLLQKERREGCDEDVEEAVTILDALRSIEGEALGSRLFFLTHSQVTGAVNTALNTSTKISTKTVLAIIRQHIDAHHFDEDGKPAVSWVKRHRDRGFIVRHLLPESERQAALPDS